MSAGETPGDVGGALLEGAGEGRVEVRGAGGVMDGVGDVVITGIALLVGVAARGVV